jgi:hypothetical protein
MTNIEDRLAGLKYYVNKIKTILPQFPVGTKEIFDTCQNMLFLIAEIETEIKLKVEDKNG